MKTHLCLDAYKNVKTAAENSKQIGNITSLVSFESLYPYDIDCIVKIWKIFFFFLNIYCTSHNKILIHHCFTHMQVTNNSINAHHQCRPSSGFLSLALIYSIYDTL